MHGRFGPGLASKRDAKGIDKQLAGAELFKGRMPKNLEEAKVALRACEKEQEEVAARVAKQQKAVAEAEAAMCKATMEVTALAAQCAAEGTGPGEPGVPATAAAPEGFVPCEFASEKWVEREKAFTQELEQLRALVAAQPDPGAPAVGQTADADLGDDPAEVEETQIEDETWTQMPKGGRKALLRKQRDELAAKVRTKLKSVSVASAHTPFLKRH